MRRLVFLLSLLLITAVAEPRAWAVGSDDPVTLKTEADALFDKGRYAEAYDLYKRVWAKTANPALLYNQARALESMGEYPEALDKLEAFSRDAPPEVRAKVPKLNELLADLQQRISTINVTTNARSARLYVRGKDLGALEHERSVRARSGEATIRVEADGYAPFTREVLLTGGTTVNIDAKLTPDKGAPSTTKLTSQWWFWTALGVVVVSGVTLTVVALTLEKDPEQGTFSPTPVRVKGFTF